MSRAYRIRVRETLRRVIRAQDHVSSQLELLQILPAEQMADLLGEELVRRGFERTGDIVRRAEQGVTVTIDLATGTVNVQAEASEKLNLEGNKDGVVYDDFGTSESQAKQQLSAQLRENLEQDARRKTEHLQKQVTDKLEGQLADLTSELDRAVNRATAEALKRKAAQIGQIKQMTDDPESGSLTIVVEV